MMKMTARNGCVLGAALSLAGCFRVAVPLAEQVDAGPADTMGAGSGGTGLIGAAGAGGATGAAGTGTTGTDTGVAGMYAAGAGGSSVSMVPPSMGGAGGGTSVGGGGVAGGTAPAMDIVGSSGCMSPANMNLLVNPADADHDGFPAGCSSGQDCNDSDANVNPKQTEFFNGGYLVANTWYYDYNCDGVIELQYRGVFQGCQYLKDFDACTGDGWSLGGNEQVPDCTGGGAYVICKESNGACTAETIMLGQGCR